MTVEYKSKTVNFRRLYGAKRGPVHSLIVDLIDDPGPYGEQVVCKDAPQAVAVDHLCLSLSYNIISDVGGRLEGRNEAAGAVFTFTLPLVEGQA